VEGAHHTLQDRLVKELRLAGISTIEAANAFLPAFVQTYNGRFAKPPARDRDLHAEADCFRGRTRTNARRGHGRVFVEHVTAEVILFLAAIDLPSNKCMIISLLSHKQNEKLRPLFSFPCALLSLRLCTRLTFFLASLL
jgi:hypothetical protein